MSRVSRKNRCRGVGTGGTRFITALSSASSRKVPNERTRRGPVILSPSTPLRVNSAKDQPPVFDSPYRGTTVRLVAILPNVVDPGLPT